MGPGEGPVGHLGAEAAEASAQYVAVVDGVAALVHAARAAGGLGVVLPHVLRGQQGADEPAPSLGEPRSKNKVVDQAV